MTLQEILDKVSAHLVKQNKVCGNGDVCYYRHNGLMCAAGCLIPDKLYHPNLEFRPADSPRLAPIWAALEIDNDGQYLIRQLQMIHDQYKPTQWKQKLRALATSHKLMIPQCIAKD